MTLASQIRPVSDYEKRANDLLERFSVTFSAVLIGSDCPRFCEDAEKSKGMDLVDTYPRKSHIHGKHYRATFTRSKGPIGREAEDTKGKWKTGSLTIDFWNGYTDEEYNYLRIAQGHKRVVTAYDVLSCIQKYEVGAFADFCSGFGYDSDSIKALETFRAVEEEWLKVRAFFTAEELMELQEIN